MKKFALYTFFTLSSALIASEGIKYEIDPVLSYNNFDSSSKMESTFMYGIRGTLPANDYYAYRLSYQRSDNVHYASSAQFTEKTTDVQRISGQVLMHGEEEYNVVPYILLGLGFESLSDETTHDVSQGYVEGGLGFKYNLYNNLYANVEGSVLKKFDTDDVDYIVNLGFGYMLGNPINKPKLYQQSVLDKGPIADNRYFKEQNVAKNIVVENVTRDAVDTKYTFNETQYIPEIDTISSSVTTEAIASPVVYDAQPVNTNLYYVQVAAWFKSIDEKLLNKLDSRGFIYDIENTVRKGRDVQLVKVGPYEQYADAKVALRDLKKIKRDAYITKLK